ncbi:meiotically up-regulated gene 14 protein [Aspergillus udagawae]|uniref:Meiotically up-regulated gene 14 protein n=1 Tax=Aspergillus udagawae TaxID=91492 RepID=A0ABQ1B8B7_9EURO|nr:meiotically up-regulated gene 14 protein [Aspergillus udagawae]
MSHEQRPLPSTSSSSSSPAHHDPEQCHLHHLSHGPNPLKGIPQFKSINEHRKHILIHMAAVFRNWARVGFIEGISGHISVRDPEHPEYMWMNPIGKHFGLMIASDMLCINIASGAIVAGNKTRPANSPGFFIHSEIHKARPDVHAICHAHTVAGRAWAAFGKPLDMITQDVCTLYGALVASNEYGGIVTAEQEGQQIAAMLGSKGKAAILLNHGLITVGSTVDEASFLLGLVDRSCDIQLRVESACAGNPTLNKHIIPDSLARSNSAIAGERNWLYEEAQPDIEYEIAMAGGAIQAGLEDIQLAPPSSTSARTPG